MATCSQVWLPVVGFEKGALQIGQTEPNGPYWIAFQGTINYGPYETLLAAEREWYEMMLIWQMGSP